MLLEMWCLGLWRMYLNDHMLVSVFSYFVELLLDFLCCLISLTIILANC